MSDDTPIRVLRGLALLGFAAGVAVHILALTGRLPPVSFGAVMVVLHVGIFVVFVPSLLYARRIGGQWNRLAWEEVSKRCPRWISRATLLIGAYAFINFALFMMTNNKQPLAVLRGFSGHWMIFYFSAFAILTAVLNPDATPGGDGS